MQITKIKDLIASLHDVYGNNWSKIARGVQENGFYKNMEIRSLADKIRKAVSCGALSHLNLSAKTKDECEDEVEVVTVNPYGCNENTKLQQLHNLILSSADDILTISGFNPGEFKLESCKFQFWNVFCKSKRGAHQISELFSASVSATPRATNT